LFRHSYATEWLARSGNSIQLQKIRGHKSLAMISQTYSHLSAGDTFDAMMRTLWSEGALMLWSRLLYRAAPRQPRRRRPGLRRAGQDQPPRP
jgi:hypothetical protein